MTLFQECNVDRDPEAHGIRRMKILHVITGLERGGAERSLYSLVHHNVEGVHIIVSLTTLGFYGPLFLNAGFQTIALNMRGPKGVISSLLRLWQIVKMEQPDVVQTWMYHANLLGGIAARCAGCSNTIWNIRMTNPKSARYSLTTRAVAWLGGKVSLFIPKRVIYCAHAAQSEHHKFGYTNSNSLVITNGFDLSEYKPDPVARRAIRSSCRVDDSVMLFGVVGRSDPIKNHSGVVTAVSQLTRKYQSGWRLVFIGSDMDESNLELKKLLEELGILEHVDLLGPKDQMVKWYNAMDVLISNSLDEGFPNVVAESMACGTPAIVTNVGDSVFITGQTGWVINPDNSAQLCEAMANAIEERSLTDWPKKLDDCRSRSFEILSLDNMLEQYNNVWSESPQRGNP